MFFFTFVYSEGEYKLNEYQFSTNQNIRKKNTLHENLYSSEDDGIGNIQDLQFSVNQNDDSKTKEEWMQRQIIFIVLADGGDGSIAVTTLKLTKNQLQNKFLEFEDEEIEHTDENPVDINSIEVENDKLFFLINEDNQHEYDIFGYGDNLCFKVPRQQMIDTDAIDFHSSEQDILFQMHDKTNLFWSIQKSRDKDEKNERTNKICSIDYESNKLKVHEKDAGDLDDDEYKKY